MRNFDVEFKRLFYLNLFNFCISVKIHKILTYVEN